VGKPNLTTFSPLENFWIVHLEKIIPMPMSRNYSIQLSDWKTTTCRESDTMQSEGKGFTWFRGRQYLAHLRNHISYQ